MNTTTITKTKIGKIPVVVLPLKNWIEIEEQIEDVEMFNSIKYKSSILEARKDIISKKLFELDMKSGKFKKFK